MKHNYYTIIIYNNETLEVTITKFYDLDKLMDYVFSLTGANMKIKIIAHKFKK